MLYSNQDLESHEREMEFGKIYQLSMGEIGRGRRLMAVTCPKGTNIKSGMNQDYTIGTTKSGKPRLNKMTDNALYMMLSAQGGYTRRGNGTIRVLASQKEEFEVMARGNGADGAAGKIGYWDCLLLKAPQNGIVQVRTSGGGYGTPSDLYLIHKGNVYHCHLDDLADCCDALDIDVPCEIVEERDGIQFGNDWVTL